ncbi:hypothetical protein GUJ93_ZPchr0008g11640 [Zizania palustris]|uniref:Uncharacterized protein n=1 Tax=Zizania palustris TaxID=103762 RepID=A0A8J5RJB5_ZIZPA|nr:hypothetical protein GUJ93_ZPchr0008g11640 [Zizania palustris]
MILLVSTMVRRLAAWQTLRHRVMLLVLPEHQPVRLGCQVAENGRALESAHDVVTHECAPAPGQSPCKA